MFLYSLGSISISDFKASLSNSRPNSIVIRQIKKLSVFSSKKLWFLIIQFFFQLWYRYWWNDFCCCQQFNLVVFLRIFIFIFWFYFPYALLWFVFAFTFRSVWLCSKLRKIDRKNICVNGSVLFSMSTSNQPWNTFPTRSFFYAHQNTLLFLLPTTDYSK